MHNSLQLIDRTCEYNEASSYERRRSAMNNPGAVELKRVEIGSVWSLRLFVDAESARQWGMELKKGDTDETRIFLFSMKTSCWHWSTGVPFPIGCLNLWPFRAQSMVELSPSFEATSYLVLYPFWLHLWTDHLCVCICVCTFLIRSREKDPPPAFLLLPRLFFSLNSLFIHTYVHISPSSIHASMDFFTGVGYERLIFLLPLISHRRETRLAVNFLSEHCSYCLILCLW